MQITAVVGVCVEGSNVHLVVLGATNVSAVEFVMVTGHHGARLAGYIVIDLHDVCGDVFPLKHSKHLRHFVIISDANVKILLVSGKRLVYSENDHVCHTVYSTGHMSLRAFNGVLVSLLSHSFELKVM